MTVTVLNAFIRPLLEGRLPGWVQPHWFASTEELFELAPQAEIGWFDSFDMAVPPQAARRGERLRWLNTLAAGVELYPLDVLASRGVTFTNGAGLGAVPIAEFIVMGMLTVAKDWRAIVRAQDRREWLPDAPGKQELFGSKAMVLGAGAIGSRVAELLRPFGVEVTTVRRNPGPQDIGTADWRARLGEFDWVIVLVPATAETEGMIGAQELAAMKPGAVLLNFARGSVVDTNALVAALTARRISALLDVTDPEPLPADHPLWGLENCHISPHASGRAQTRLFMRAADRFIANLGRWERGEPLESLVDLSLGY